MNPREGVRPTTAILVAVVATMASWLLLMLLHSTAGAYPVITWFGLVPLLLLAVLVLAMAWQIRRYVRGRTPGAVTPQRGRGTLVGAQAAALGGAALLGWYAANALVHVPDADVPSQRAQLLWAVAHLVGALVLAVSGFVAQHWCRIPPGDDDEEGRGPGLRDGDLAWG